MKLAREVMTRGVVSVRHDSDLGDVARSMVKNDISGVAVTDPEEGTVGVVTKADLVRHFGEQGLTAEDAMTELPETVHPTADLMEASEKMAREGVHHLFVMPRGEIFECDTCMGVLTSTDLVEAMAEGD